MTVESKGTASRQERAVLVGVDLSARPTGNRAGQLAARSAAVCSESPAAESASSTLGDLSTNFQTAEIAAPLPDPGTGFSTGLDADESFAEFRELVLSAGGMIAADQVQR